MNTVQILPRIGRRGRQLGLGAVLWIGMIGAVQAQTYDYYATTCKLFQFSGNPVGVSTPWVNTGLDTSTVDNVIARRTLVLSSSAALKIRDTQNTKPTMIIGARWAGAPTFAGSIIPTNVKGLGIRVSRDAAVVKAEVHDNFLTLFTSRIMSSKPPLEAINGHPEMYGEVIDIELVVIGQVAPGAHRVTGLDPEWDRTVFEAVTLQRPAASAPMVGTSVDAPTDDGVSPIGGWQCYQRLTYDVADMLTLEGGGPVIEAKCTVDAKFTGAGFTLPMSTHHVNDFPNDGDVGREVPFSVSVNSCSAGAKPRIAFNAQYGLVQGGAGNVLQLKDAGLSDTAKNLGIILTRAGHTTPLSIGDGPGAVGAEYDFDNIPGVGVAANAAAEIALEARYKRVDQSGSPGVEAGAANSQVNFKIYYD